MINKAFSVAPSLVAQPSNPFRHYLKSQLDQIRFVRRAALGKADFLRGMILGRELRGQGPSYGFPTLSKLGTDLISAARNRDPRAFDESLERLRSYLSQQLVAFS